MSGLDRNWILPWNYNGLDWLRGLEATYTEHDCSLSEGGLENRCTGNRTVGSNPTLSANNYVIDIPCRYGFGEG
jgi:hypothetical protein